MGYIAKGTITLNTVNDAYTVSLSKSSCVIKADFDGTNPKLSDAQTVITVCRGDKSMAFNCTLAEEFSPYASVTPSDERQKYVLKINNLPSDELEGSISATVTTDDGFTTDIQFGYSVVRESTMLDWIKDWEGGKTKIGNTYVMTPKIFIGKKAQYAEYSTNGTNAKEDIMAVPELTGVYIGPDSDSTGIYGYKNSVEIFHLNNDGGSIGGWNIGQNYINSKNGLMYISSAGSIYAQDSNGKHIWELNEDGSAKFACGNATFDASGNAAFTGKITSSSGNIGGWSITSNQIRSGNLILDKKTQVIGIVRSGVYMSADQNNSQEIEGLKSITRAGGVGFYYNSDSDWGLIGRTANTAWQTTDASISFKLGSSNSIAGWNFDKEALWSGTKNNAENNFTASGITIGSTGLRSTKWRFEKDGSGSLAGGNLTWDTSGNLSVNGKVTATSGSIGGITINQSSISASKFTLNSNGSGSLAGNNIVWDTKGNITLSSAVKFTLSDNTTATIQGVKDALETTINNGDKNCISKIEQTAAGISSTVSSLKSNVYTNLFGFCKDIAFEGVGTMLPYIQAYGVYYTGSTHYRIKNLGFNGTGGDFVMRCRVYSTAAVTVNFDICDKASNEGRADVSANTWVTVVRTFSGVTSYVDASGYNGFFDAEVSNSSAQITIADLSIERGTVATSVCTICKEDAAAFGKGYRIQEWNNGGAGTTTDTVNGESVTVYQGAVPSSNYTDFLRKDNNKSAGNSKVYTLSFWAKADVSGMKVNSYLYGNSNCPDGGREYTESLTGGGSQSVRNAVDGRTETTLTTTWEKYYVHWKTVNDKTFNVIPIRIDGSLNAAYAGMSIYVANVVFEEGYICEENAASAYSYSKIEQTANSISLKVKTAQDTADGISKGLKDTGIDIESKKVTITADKFTVKNNSDEEVLHSDKDGNLVVSGKVTATSGSIGGIAINQSSISASKFTLNSNGSGSLAGNNIVWDTSGNLSVSGKVTATSGTFSGDIYVDTLNLQACENSYDSAGNLISTTGSMIVSTSTVRLPALGKKEIRQIHYLSLVLAKSSTPPKLICADNVKIALREGMDVLGVLDMKYCDKYSLGNSGYLLGVGPDTLAGIEGTVWFVFNIEAD